MSNEAAAALVAEMFPDALRRIAIVLAKNTTKRGDWKRRTWHYHAKHAADHLGQLYRPGVEQDLDHAAVRCLMALQHLYGHEVTP